MTPLRKHLLGAIGIKTGAVGSKTGVTGRKTGANERRTVAIGRKTGAPGSRTRATGTNPGATANRTGPTGTSRKIISAKLIILLSINFAKRNRSRLRSNTLRCRYSSDDSLSRALALTTPCGNFLTNPCPCLLSLVCSKVASTSGSIAGRNSCSIVTNAMRDIKATGSEYCICYRKRSSNSLALCNGRRCRTLRNSNVARKPIGRASQKT